MPLNKPSPRLSILRAQLAAEADAIRLQRASYKISSAVGCSCPVPAPDADSLPLPPSYDEDLEHWLKTLAPAKTAAPKTPFPAPPQLPPVPGLALADLRAYLRDRPASTSSASDGAALIDTKTAAPAQQPAQNASTHSVCIKAYDEFTVGTVLPVPCDPSFGYWLPCDESGWVTHVPTADAVCPVPEGLDFVAMWGDGEVSSLASWYLRKSGDAWRPTEPTGGLRAWRPIAQS